MSAKDFSLRACSLELVSGRGEGVRTYAGSVEEYVDLVTKIMYKASASCCFRHGKAALYGPVDKGIYPQTGCSFVRPMLTRAITHKLEMDRNCCRNCWYGSFCFWHGKAALYGPVDKGMLSTNRRRACTRKLDQVRQTWCLAFLFLAGQVSLWYLSLWLARGPPSISP